MEQAAIDLRRAREAVVREHMDSENRHAFADTVATFARPRYEVIPTGDVHVGVADVRTFLDETYRAFPDMRIDLTSLHHTDQAVIVEVVFHGTHLGPWRGLPATGRKVEYAMCNVFEFDGSGLVCERLYFDLTTPLRQLGIARDPTTLVGRVAILLNHPLTVGRALARALRR
jgi:steroid delta-isomerase-like uncharacterized protein